MASSTMGFFCAAARSVMLDYLVRWALELAAVWTAKAEDLSRLGGVDGAARTEGHNHIRIERGPALPIMGQVFARGIGSSSDDLAKYFDTDVLVVHPSMALEAPEG